MICSFILVLEVALDDARNSNIDGHHVLNEHCDHLVALLIVVIFERLQIIALCFGLVGRVLAIDLRS